MAQLPDAEIKKQKKRLKTKEVAPAAAEEEETSEESPKRKGRRQMVDETILGRYHQSQQLQGILKKQKHGTDDQEEDHLAGEEGENIHTGSEETAAQQHVTTEELQTEADQVLEDVNKLEREKKKKLAKEKKKFKAQQRKLKQQEEEQQPKENKQDRALAYMKQWKRHRDEWKFKKINHIWLLKNWKHSSKIPDKKFKTFLKYLKSTEQKSLALQRLQAEAKTIVDSSSSTTAATEDADQQDSQSSDDHSYDRARSILQWTV